MNERQMICTGGTGSLLVALCCFTPILAVVLPALGLAAWLGWIDYVLFPALAGFLALTAYGFYVRRKAAAREATKVPGEQRR